MLKKPSMDFSTSSFEKCGFQMTPIFNGGTSMYRALPVEKHSFSTGS